MYNGQVWFTNDYNPLYFSDGASVRSYQGVDLPSARYVESFYDHVVVGNYRYKGEHRPNGILSSDLYNPSVWSASHANEAARIDFEEFGQADFPLTGLTGLRRMNNLLVAYLPTAIIGLRYVGLPNVYQWDPIAENCGNSLMYGLASHRNVHFFFDGVELNFYSFSGNGLEVIGTRIAAYFAETVSTDFELMQRTWAFCWREKQEVWWVYCSTESEGEYDKAVVYNWQSKEWYTADIEDLHSFGGLVRRAKTCDQLGSTTADALTGEADALSITGENVVPRLWGRADATVAREAISTDTPINLLSLGGPELVTKDFDYGEPDTIKEVDAINIDAEYGGNAEGVDVYVSARGRINDPVEYKLVGRWNRGLAETELTFAALHGNYFRYKFVLAGQHIQNVRWSLWAETVYHGKAEK
jgi:hypothetical protein